MKKVLVIILVFSCVSSFSQNKIELLNKGNEYYQKEEYENAEYYYKQALEKDNTYFKGNLNTGHSLFKQAVYLIQNQDTTATVKLEESEQFYNNSVNLSKNKNEKAESHYNAGNSQLLSGKIEESIESYKNSLRLVPENIQAKHNLALAQSIKNKQDQKQEQQEQQEQQKQQEEDKQKQEQQSDNKEDLSKEEIEQILNALEREEKEVQEDIQKKKVVGNGKLLKDW
tara:strand:- start:26537 stop:27217 length:681 start_codon:yes stop_codon:yes gene_type:complete